MKLFIAFALLFILDSTIAQQRTDPVLHMGNISNPFDVDASGNRFTSFSFEIKGFDDVEAGEQGAQSLLDTGRLTSVEDPCSRSDNMCAQECVNYTIGLYQCFCSKGYEDKTTDAVPPSSLPQKGFVCEDIDECLEPAPCGKGQESCNNTIGSYNCTCVDGYTVSDDLESCIDFDECLNDTLTNCHANAHCINMDGTFRCECDRGYDGDGLNCTDIDECTTGNYTCGDRGDCSNTDGSFRCTCDLGFQEDNSTGTPTCIDFDECTLDTSCTHPDSECANTVGSFNCKCKKGFSGDGLNCTDIDECTNPVLNLCHRNATCSNTHGNYTCECSDSFLGDGFTCQEGELSYCFRGQVFGRVDIIRMSSDALTANQMNFALQLLFQQYQRNLDNFFVNGFNVSVEPTDTNILIIKICFDRISKTPDELGQIFLDNSPVNTVNGQFWAFRDYDECAVNYLNCDEEASCENTMGDAICTCPDNRYDGSGVGDGSAGGLACMEPIEFDCEGSIANISLLTPYWDGKYINVKNVFVNQGCSGSTDGMWHRYRCDGTVTANATHLIASFRVADVIPPGGFAINRLDTTFQCIQPAQQNFTSNITAQDNIVDPGVDTVDNAESSLKPLVFLDGFENAVVEGVKTGEKACVKLEDPNIPENIKIMIEELHTSAPGDDTKFTLLKDYCPVEIGGIDIETTNGGICFTMHRPQASTLLEVQLVVNLCTTEDCPTPSCARRRRSALSRTKRSEQLQAISFLIKIDPEDTCDRDCGVGACLLDYLNQKQCICPEQSIKLEDGKCKATRQGSGGIDSSYSTSGFTPMVLVLVILAGAFLILIAGFVVFYTRRRNAILVNDKQMEMRGVYTNTITAD